MSQSMNSLDLAYLDTLASIAIVDAKAQDRPALWLWNELEATSEGFIKCCEARANSPRKQMNELGVEMERLENKALALLAALAVIKGKLPDDLEGSEDFFTRLIDIRENEQSLEDMIYEERNVLWG